MTSDAPAPLDLSGEPGTAPDDFPAPDSAQLRASLTLRIDRLREQLCHGPVELRPWTVLELCEALATRFEVTLMHPELFGEVDRADLDELRRVSADAAFSSFAPAPLPDDGHPDDGHPVEGDPASFARIAVQVPRAIAAVYLFTVDEDLGLLADAAAGLRWVRSCPQVGPEMWVQAGDLLCRVLDEHITALDDDAPALDALLAEALDLLPQAARAAEDVGERAELTALAGRLRLRRLRSRRTTQDPELPDAELDRAITELAEAAEGGPLEPLDVYLLADALTDRHDRDGRVEDLREALAVLDRGLAEEPVDATRLMLQEFRGQVRVALAAADSDGAVLAAGIEDLRTVRDAHPPGQRLHAVISLAEALLRSGGIENRDHPGEARELVECLAEILHSPEGLDPDLEELTLTLAVVVVQVLGQARRWDDDSERLFVNLSARVDAGEFRGLAEALMLGLLAVGGLMRAELGLMTGTDPADFRAAHATIAADFDRALAHPDLPSGFRDDLEDLAGMAALTLATLPVGWSSNRAVATDGELPSFDLEAIARAEPVVRRCARRPRTAWFLHLLEAVKALATDGDAATVDVEHLAAVIPAEAAADPRMGLLMTPLLALAQGTRAARTGRCEDLEEAALRLRDSYRIQPPGSPMSLPMRLSLSETLGQLALLRGDADAAQEAVVAVLDALPGAKGQRRTAAVDQLAVQLVQARPLLTWLSGADRAAAELAADVRAEAAGPRRDRLAVALEVAVELASGPEREGPQEAPLQVKRADQHGERPRDKPSPPAAELPPEELLPTVAEVDSDRLIARLESTTTSASDRIADLARAADLLRLAAAYHERGRVRPGGADESRAFGTVRVALQELSRCVLLADELEPSLAAARLAQEWLPVVVDWCLDAADPVSAVEVTEAGRALILAAATASGTVAETLAEAGEPDLARHWQGATTPAALRRQALEALARSPRGLMTAAHVFDIDDITATLWVAGVDAIAYLLPGTGSTCGRLLAVRSGGTVDHLELPQLDATDPRLHRFHTASAAVLGADGHGSAADGHGSAADGQESAADGQQRRIDALRQALPGLGSWAHETVIGPLLQLTGRWGLMRCPRVVLIPVGELAAVPWHAARRPTDDGGAGYACADLVLTYAASARQLSDAARRMRLPLDQSPAVVADPLGDLTWAGLAGEAIQQVFYPSGTYLGQPPEASAGRWGTVQEVTSLLPAADRDGASLLQLSTHAATGPSPDLTALVLADGQLPVGELLRQARRRPTDAPGGLVVCDACVTDVTVQAQDEALTLSTALLAAGAVSVIGTRWPVEDASTAVMMFMFHHYLDGGRTRPADALRAAALWMLDPDRTLPATMPPRLAERARKCDLTDPYAWAGFTHHGQ